MYNKVKLNLGRNCLRYIIRAYNIKEIFLPYYLCSVIWKSVKQENRKIHFYKIDENFMPIDDFGENDYILYPNYYGLCSNNCKILARKYKNLILDNTHSYYSSPIGLASFNSYRKFSPVPIGADLYIKKTLKEELKEENLDISFVNSFKDYNQFVRNEKLLNKCDIKLASLKTEEEIKSFDIEKDKETRIKLFNLYKEKFDRFNNLHFEIKNDEIPYCYPLSVNDSSVKYKILESNIICIRLWDINLDFAPDIVALPIYNLDYARKLLNINF